MDYVVWYRETDRSINSFEAHVVLLRVLKNVEKSDAIEYVAKNLFANLVREFDDSLLCREQSLKEYVKENVDDELEKYFITALDEKGYPTGAVALSYYKECIKDEIRIKCEKES